jgi:hypothetical protein
MPQNTTNTEEITDCPMSKDWIQIRIERETAAELDKVHIERRESYNDIIRRLLQFWENNPDAVQEWKNKQVATNFSLRDEK